MFFWAVITVKYIKLCLPYVKVNLQFTCKRIFTVRDQLCESQWLLVSHLFLQRSHVYINNTALFKSQLYCFLIKGNFFFHHNREKFRFHDLGTSLSLSSKPETSSLDSLFCSLSSAQKVFQSPFWILVIIPASKYLNIRLTLSVGFILGFLGFFFF